MSTNFYSALIDLLDLLESRAYRVLNLGFVQGAGNKAPANQEDQAVCRRLNVTLCASNEQNPVRVRANRVVVANMIRNIEFAIGRDCAYTKTSGLGSLELYPAITISDVERMTQR